MKKIVVLTGAGMSAESGISTFRDSGGLWDKYPVEEVATPEGFATNPQRVLEFYNIRRKELVAAKPNDGHIGLAKLEENFDVKIITQNIDNLHEQAGSTYVMHLHGELLKARSVADPELIVEITQDQNYEIHWGDKGPDNQQLRPHIVWFGEAVPMIESAVELVSQADIFVIIGTSLNVYPAAGLLDYVPLIVPVYLIDPQSVDTHRRNVHFIRKGATEGVAELATILRKFYV